MNLCVLINTDIFSDNIFATQYYKYHNLKYIIKEKIPVIK